MSSTSPTTKSRKACVLLVTNTKARCAAHHGKMKQTLKRRCKDGRERGTLWWAHPNSLSLCGGDAANHAAGCGSRDDDSFWFSTSFRHFLDNIFHSAFELGSVVFFVLLFEGAIVAVPPRPSVSDGVIVPREYASCHRERSPIFS